MINDFIQELSDTLHKLGCESDSAVSEYTARYRALLQSGKSEFESVMALGDPIAAAYRYAGAEYNPDASIIASLEELTDTSEVIVEDLPAANTGESRDYINKAEMNTENPDFQDKADDSNGDGEPYSTGEKVYYGIFAAVIAILDVALIFVACLTGIISVSYAILAFMHFSPLSTALTIFGLSVLGFITFVIFMTIAAVILKRLIVSSKKIFLKGSPKN